MVVRRKALHMAVLLGVSLGLNSLVQAVEPNSIQVGAIDLIPTLKLDVSQDDNIFRTPEDEVESVITILAPKLQAVIQSNTNLFSLEAEALKGEYEATSEDDFDDWRVAANAHIEITRRNILDFSYSFDDTHEVRGTGFSEGANIPDKPDEYEQTRFDFRYQFGTNESIGRLVFNTGYSDKEYTNNLDVTVFRDREDDRLGATFYINLSPRTAILLEYRQTKIDYVTDLPFLAGGLDTLDSEETYAFVGIEWEATAQISGSIRVGRGEKDFVDVDRFAIDEPIYEVGLQWTPLSYSTIDFSASSLFDEANGTGNAIERDTLSLRWQHDWSDRFSTIVTASRMDEVYGGSLREDELNNFSVGIKYAFARWLDFHMEVIKDDRESTQSALVYDRPVFSLGFEMSL